VLKTSGQSPSTSTKSSFAQPEIKAINSIARLVIIF
jgi:hypothetical protein